MTSSTSEATCPTTYDYTLVNQDLSTIDSAVFVYDGSSVLTISTSDVNKAAAYPLKLQVSYTGAGYAVAGSLDFTVNILKTCIDATLTIASSTLTATPVNYEITAGAPSTETFV